MKIYLASTSSLKKTAIQYILRSLSRKQVLTGGDQVITENIASGVPLTPFEEETFMGAKQRALKLSQQHPDPESCFVGLESGLVKRHGSLFEECWCVLLDSEGNEYVGYSSGYSLPKKIREYMKKGGKHLDALGKLEKELGISQKDTWAIYTKNVMGRKTSVKEAFRNAFLAFIYQ